MTTQDTLHHTTEVITRSFTDWDRLRNPNAGWARVALGLLAPFIIWSHDWMLIILYIGAICSHHYWFMPITKHKKGEKPHIFSRMVDAWLEWLKTASRTEKTMLYVPGIALALPLICFFWTHQLAWGLYFFVAAIMYKASAALWLIERTESPAPVMADPVKSEPVKKEAAAKKNTAKKTTKKPAAKKTAAKKTAAKRTTKKS